MFDPPHVHFAKSGGCGSPWLTAPLRGCRRGHRRYSRGVSADVILAIETSSRQGGVALARGAALLASEVVDAHPGVAAELLPTLDRLLSGAGLRLNDVSIVAFSCGPGSFTGLRIAATVARMAQSVCGIRVVAVPTLEAIAWNWFALSADPAGPLAVLLDAKRGQVYGGVYMPEGAVGADLTSAPTSRVDPRLLAPAVRAPAAWLAALPRPLWATGEGVSKHRAACEAAGVDVVDAAHWTPRAEAVAAIGWQMAVRGAFCPAEHIVPLYLRPPECEEVYDQRRAAAKARRE